MVERPVYDVSPFVPNVPTHDTVQQWDPAKTGITANK
jgi:hypothetical protein